MQIKISKYNVKSVFIVKWSDCDYIELLFFILINNNSYLGEVSMQLNTTWYQYSCWQIVNTSTDSPRNKVNLLDELQGKRYLILIPRQNSRLLSVGGRIPEQKIEWNHFGFL